MCRGKRLASLCALVALFFISTIAAGYAYGHSMTYGHGTLTVLRTPASPQTKEFVVYVGRTGFNGSSDSFNIVVNEGDTVRIQFVYGDTNLDYDNPHQIMIEGYDVTTERISRANPVETVEFVAGQSGEFAFHCILPCNGHPLLQKGTLSVIFTAGAALPTRMALSLEQTVGKESAIAIAATLTDAREEPVVGAIVQFYVNTTFGQMKIGSSTTNAEGRAGITYSPRIPGEVQIIVVYGGGAKYEPSTTMSSIMYEARMAEEPSEGFPFVLGQNRLPDISLVGFPSSTSFFIASVLGLVVGGVWATYVFVVKQVVDIRKYGKVNDKTKLTIVQPESPFSLTKIALAAAGLLGLGVMDSLALDILQLSVTMRVPVVVVMVMAEVFVFIRVMKKLEVSTDE